MPQSTRRLTDGLGWLPPLLAGLFFACGEDGGDALRSQRIIPAKVHPESYPTARGLRVFADEVTAGASVSAGGRLGCRRDRQYGRALS